MNKGQQTRQSVGLNSCIGSRHLQEYPSKMSLSKLGLTLVLLFSGSLTLFGCATSPAASSTQTAGGIGVPTTERTLAQRVLDESIEHTARVNIYALDEALRDNSRLGVDSFYSEVLLTGEVPDANTKEEITKIVSSMPDVKNLYNRLSVSRPKGSSYTLHDGYITSKLKAKILANKQIHGSQIKVVTDDGVVYVLGKLTPSEQGRLIDIVDGTVGIKELVLLTTLVDDSGQVLTQDKIMQENGLQRPTFSPTQTTYPKTNKATMQSSTVNTPVSVEQEGDHSDNKSSTTSSPYIELYKHQVADWQ